MGFVENMTVVSESVGSFIVTVRVFLPEPRESLPVQFFLDLETQDGSAGEEGREGGREGGKDGRKEKKQRSERRRVNEII